MYRPNSDVFHKRRSRPVPSKDSAHEPYICALCRHILDLDRPRQPCCGDRACYTCLEVLASEFKQRGINNVKCPGCQKPIQPSEFFLGHAFARELKCILVTCPNHECQWRNSYAKYQYHLQRCPLKCLEGASTTKEPAFESEQATSDPGFAGSEVLTGSNRPLSDLSVYALPGFEGEVVPGIKRLLPTVMEVHTNECVLPSIPRLPQMNVINDVQRQLVK